MRTKILLLLALCLLFCGCDAEPAEALPPDLPSGSIITVGRDVLPYTEDALFSQLFELGNKISFRLKMDEGEIAKMQRDYEQYSSFGSKSPIYRMADLYIREEFTDWAVKKGFEMQAEGDVFTFRLSGNKKLRFKVYSRALDRWYGSEDLTEQTDAQWSTDDHTNIILPAGNYQVVFDPATATITVHVLDG